MGNLISFTLTFEFKMLYIFQSSNKTVAHIQITGIGRLFWYVLSVYHLVTHLMYHLSSYANRTQQNSAYTGSWSIVWIKLANILPALRCTTIDERMKSRVKKKHTRTSNHAHAQFSIQIRYKWKAKNVYLKKPIILN